jgi:acyl-CoA thioesterase-1
MLSPIRVLLWVVLLPLSGVCAAGPVILVLGDSLSAAHGMPVEAGWPALLARKLDASGSSARVINASISGETTAGGLTRLPALLEEHQPDVLLLQLGANDGLRGLPIDQIRANLYAMLDRAAAAQVDVVLLGIELPVNFGRRYRSELRAVYAGLAQARNVALVPFLLEGVALDAALMQEDGLHPNARAQPQLLENIWPVLAPLLDGG